MSGSADDLVRITFPEANLRAAGAAADELRGMIAAQAPQAETKVIREDPTTQDGGATLAIVATILGTPAAIAVARGIAAWIARNRQKVKFTRNGDSVVFEASGTIDENTARIAEAFGVSAR